MKETVEEAAGIYDRDRQNEFFDEYTAFIEGANWQKRQSNQEVIELIQNRLELCYANYHSQDAIDILTDLLTQIRK